MADRNTVATIKGTTRIPDADTKNERARFPYPGLVPAAPGRIPGSTSSESRNVLLHSIAAALRAGDQRQSRPNAQRRKIWCRRPARRRHPAAKAAREGIAGGRGATSWRPRGGGGPVSHLACRTRVVWSVSGIGAVEL
jgi:hypothetical protein